LTQEEAGALLWSDIDSFNEKAARALASLYRWRKDKEMTAYYESKIIPYNHFNKNGDCFGRDVNTGKLLG
jgi:glycogen debranching enzyme